MKLKLQLQHDQSDCAAACLRMILDYFGKSTNLRKIRMLAGTDTMGTSGYGLQVCAKENGLTCKGFKAPEKNIIRNIPFPAIFHIVREGINHYVIVREVKKERATVYDPALGIIKMNLQEFFQIWSGIFFLCKPEDDFSQKKDDENSLFRFFSLLSPHKKIFARIFTASIFLSILSIMIAFYFRFLIDEVLYTQVQSTLNITSLCYLLILIFQLILSFTRNQLSIIMSSKIDLSLICSFFNHLMKLPFSFFTSRKTGEILSRIRDTEVIRQTISSTTVSVLIDSVMFFIGGFFLFRTGSDLVFVAMAPVLVSSLFVFLFARPFKKLIRRKAVAMANKNACMYETINGISTVKALSAEESAFRRNEVFFVDAVNKGISLDVLGNLNQVIQSFISGLGTLLVYWVGSYRIFNEVLTLGQLISFTTLSGFFLGPLGRLLTMQPQLQEAFISAERLNDIMEIDEESDNLCVYTPELKFNEKIEFKDVDFSYGTRGKALENINLRINKGEKIGIVGCSGSGKSTLLKLLLKFYKQSNGTISIDNQNLSVISTSQLRQIFGYVPQEPLLFSGTIAENIAWGLKGFSPSKIQEAAAQANAMEFIQSQPEGFNTFVGEHGATLSGGEKQRICLARTLMRNPEILVLDEATANLDALCEQSIINTIFSLNKTTIMIAHRLSTVCKCDRIIVMDKGKIVQTGTHEELLNGCELYKNLWEAQHD